VRVLQLPETVRDIGLKVGDTVESVKEGISCARLCEETVIFPQCGRVAMKV